MKKLAAIIIALLIIIVIQLSFIAIKVNNSNKILHALAKAECWNDDSLCKYK